MARYFVLISDPGGETPYIVAEVVREADDGVEDRDLSLAGNIGGLHSEILTIAELGDTAPGRFALGQWQAGDDSAYEGDTFDDAHGDAAVVVHLLPARDA